MNSTAPNVQYRSKPAAVSMGDDYYELASLDHFWIEHRFNIFKAISRKINICRQNLRVADIGCGHGLLQCQLKDRFNWAVDGYDLNQAALRNSIASDQTVEFYDINERHDDLESLYDVIFLFDVIEHIEVEGAFLDSVKFHLKKDGFLVVNVPAAPWLFSRYDKVAGHFRRYTWKTLNDTLQSSGFSPITCTYWGLLYIPLIVARKLVLDLRKRLSNEQVNTAGFKPPSAPLNSLFKNLSTLDPLPNRFGGSSLMAIYTFS